MLFIQKIIYICIRMLLIDRIINRKLSVQISAKVVLAIALLLTIALFVMLTFSREAVTKEAHHNAEHALEYTARQIDNVLLDVEQASGNIYWDLLTHLDNPDRMTKYCEELVHACPFIAGSTIAFEPDYYKEKGPTRIPRLSIGLRMARSPILSSLGIANLSIPAVPFGLTR